MDLSSPVIMGILNATPDSFYTRGHDTSVNGLLQTAAQMIADGAAILDIGGASSRPGAAPISIEEELDRIVPVIRAVSQQFPETWISVDTFHSEVARAAVDNGACIVNDISGGTADEQMLSTVSELNVPYIIMHMQGTPQTMQQNPQYGNVIDEIIAFFTERLDAATRAGITDIIFDPGFGFGKTLEHNYQLLNHMGLFRILGKPVLAGISRKSMICKALSVTPENALNGTTALHMAALQQGASILRVHDVKEAYEAVRLFGLFV